MNYPIKTVGDLVDELLTLNRELGLAVCTGGMMDGWEEAVVVVEINGKVWIEGIEE